jgi:hypothetical protein
MTRAQLESLARGLSPVVKEIVEKATAPLSAELTQVKSENAILLTQLAGLELKLATVEGLQKSAQVSSPIETAAVERLVGLEVHKAFSQLPAPKDGTSVTVDDVAPLVAAEVARAIETLPRPEKGADGLPGPDGPFGLAGAEGRDGR